jgi:hypothetical protein
MKRIRFGSFPPLAPALSLLCLAPAAFGQDLTVHQTTTSSGMMMGAGRASTSTQYFGQKAMRTVSSDGQDTIIQFDTGKIIIIDNKQKTYSEMTGDELNRMFEKRSSEMGVDEEKLEQARKMMAQMGQPIADSFSIEKVGPGETIAGYATNKYIVKGPMEMEIHAAPALKIPALYYDLQKMRVPHNFVFDQSKLYEEMKKIDGMPVKTVTTMRMMNVEMKSTTVVTSVEEGPVPAATFQAPAGYLKVPLKF